MNSTFEMCILFILTATCICVLSSMHVMSSLTLWCIYRTQHHTNKKKCLCDYIILQIQVNIFATYTVFACRTQTMRANTVQPVKATIINQNTYRWFFKKNSCAWSIICDIIVWWGKTMKSCTNEKNGQTMLHTSKTSTIFTLVMILTVWPWIQ